MVKKLKLSPHAFCLLYAQACIEIRHERGDMTDDDHRTMRRHIHERSEPSVALMYRCFPTVYERVGHHATLRDMQRYWRVTHQNATEGTPVMCATLVELKRTDQGGEWWVARAHNPATGRVERRIVCNTQRMLSLTAGDNVYIHVHTIAEKVLA
ncbi:MAG: hypothetical protein KBD21_03290 [Candidatus Pacebacteria bacterium]|nr:hypothetical protein [Candidatus Paceibacterota bacterium]